MGMEWDDDEADFSQDEVLESTDDHSDLDENPYGSEEDHEEEYHDSEDGNPYGSEEDYPEEDDAEDGNPYGTDESYEDDYSDGVDGISMDYTEEEISSEDEQIMDEYESASGVTEILDTIGSYQGKGIPQTTIERLSKARFNKLNLELIMSSDVKISSLNNETTYELIMASLGNAEISSKPLSKLNLTQKFTTMLMNENLSLQRSESKIRFRDEYFTNITKIKKPSEQIIFFKEYIKTGKLTSSGASSLCVTCVENFAIPRYFLSDKTNKDIKKLFAFELLFDELTERQNIQLTLSNTIGDYERELLEMYTKVSNIKALTKETLRQSTILKKTAIIHAALKEEGLEDLAMSRIKEKGDIEVIYTPKQFKALLNKTIKIQAPISENKIEMVGILFSNWDKKGFAIRHHSIDDFDKEIEARKSLLGTSDKPIF